MDKYLNVPLPSASNISKATKVTWGGLERKQYVNTGTMSNAVDISLEEYPYLTPSKKKARLSTFNYIGNNGKYNDCRGIFGFDDKLIVVYSDGEKILLDYYSDVATVLGTVLNASDDSEQRSIVLFNTGVFSDTDGEESTVDILTVKFIKKLLIFPDKLSMDFKQSAGVTEIEVSTLGDSFPNIKYATVHNSRLFGVDNDKIYASGFNDYTNWTLDTMDSSEESNAWVSTAQSDVRASGDFVGITAFQNHVICFKKDYMHEIYNNKNPFRVQDIYAEGTIDQRTIQDVGGMLIFTDNDYVKVYTGGQPRILSYELNIKNITQAVAGNDGRKYYLYCVCDDILRNTTQIPHLFVYDTLTQLWSEESVYDGQYGYFEIQGFARTQKGFFAVMKNQNGTNDNYEGYIYQLDMKSYSDNWEFETDIMTNSTIDVKHLQKIQLYGEFAPESGLKIYMLYDGIYDGTELNVIEGTGTLEENVAKARLITKYYNEFPHKKTAYIRFIVPNSAHSGFKLKFKGSGYVKLYHMELFFRQGGKLYNGS